MFFFLLFCVLVQMSTCNYFVVIVIVKGNRLNFQPLFLTLLFCVLVHPLEKPSVHRHFQVHIHI